MFVKKRHLQSASAFVLALGLIGCVTDRDKTVAEIEKICGKYCKQQPKEIYTFKDIRWDPDKGQFAESPHGQIYVQTSDGLLEAPNKAKGLNPDCFSTKPMLTTEPNLEAPGESSSPVLERSLEDVTLTWKNTSIIFINFDEDGRLESRAIADSEGTPLSPPSTQGRDLYNTLNTYLDDVSGTNPSSEYLKIQYELTNFVRPNAMQLSNFGVNAVDLTPVPEEKTPFYKKFEKNGNYGKKEHVFFYVLLDEHLKFNREPAAMIPYAPAAQNAMGHLTSPYIQYRIEPEDPDTDGHKTEVMPVHFYRGGDMARGNDNSTEVLKCTYPYDLGVYAAGQTGYDQVTPLAIDPETETDGPLPD